jgi:hypothetical protein
MIELFGNASRPSLINPEQEACYSSWYSHLYDYADPSNIEKYKPTTTTSVLVYETIESFGPNLTYTDCDGIPRIRFTKLPTRSITSLVTVTVSRDNGWSYYRKDNGTKPQCGKLDPFYCRLLYAASYQEIGPDVIYNDQDIAPIPQELCPILHTCLADIEEVILIYWPDNIVSRNICALNEHGSSVTRPWDSRRGSIFTTDAITFKGQDLYLRTINGQDFLQYYILGKGGSGGYDEEVEKLREIPRIIAGESYVRSSIMLGDWSFTSPTIYMAHKAITAKHYIQVPKHESTSAMDWYTPHLIQSAGIIPLEPHDISSLRLNHQSGHINHVRIAQLIAKGAFHPVLRADYVKSLHETHSFDLADLQNPVPASVYYDARSADCWGQQSHCETITDDSYRPKLKLARSIWSSIYGDYICGDAMLFDPPISLHPLGKQELNLPQTPLSAPYLTSATPLPVQGPGSPKSPADYAGMDPERPQPGHFVASPFPVETSRAGKPWPPMGLSSEYFGWRNTDGHHRNKPQPGGGDFRSDHNRWSDSSVDNNRWSDSSVDPNRNAEERHQGIKTPAIFTGESFRRQVSQSCIWSLSLMLAGMFFL